MADKKDLDYTYTTIDRVFRLSMGEMGDFSGAMYNGDFSMTLEEAQEEKHRFIVKNLNIDPDSRVLDMGCGWGPMVSYISRQVGAECIGLSLSDGQVKACQKNGLKVYLKNCLEVKPDDYGIFDAVVSLGAFEHFCSIEAYKAGKQDEIYRNFFETVSNLLRPGGRLFLQTMTFSKNMIDYEDINIHADKDSASYNLALMKKQFPGSWLPYGSEMVIKNATPYFNMINMSSGRLDYIETLKQWGKRYRAFNLRKYLVFASWLPRFLTDSSFRALVTSNPNMICFEREIIDHYRMLFEKTEKAGG